MKRLICILIAVCGISAFCGDSYWIWAEQKVAETKSISYFRLPVNIDDDVLSAELYTIADDAMEIYVNGSKAIPLRFFDQKPARITIRRYEFKNELKDGKNMLAVVVVNQGGPGGVIMKGSIRLANGKTIDLASNEQWKSAMSTSVKGKWEPLNYDDSAWKPACKLGDASLKPWSNMSDAVNFFGLPGGAK